MTMDIATTIITSPNQRPRYYRLLNHTVTDHSTRIHSPEFIQSLSGKKRMRIFSATFISLVNREF